MPGHGSKKQSQRTKGNLRPSSSSHAAELLQASGTAPTGFIGFGQTPMYVPASSTLDDVDSSLDSDIRMVLRKLSKRDTTTKIKGLQEFSELCSEKSDECLKATLPFWPRTYNKISMDIDYRVREAAQQAMSALVLRVKRNLAPYIRSLMGAWLLSQCDTYPTVASAAQLAFQNAFPPAKQTEALVYCKQSILEFLTENLVTHTQQTLSDPKTTEPEDMENKYNRVLTSSLLAIRKLLTSIPANQRESLNQQITGLLDNAKFWKHSKSKVSMVQGALFSCLAGLCQSLPELSAQYVSKMAPLVLHNLDERDPAICSQLWEATLSLVNFSEECWKHVNAQKGFWPKLKTVLETGCHGNAVVIGPSLLPLLSRVPADLFPDQSKFLNDFFESFRTGLASPSVQKSPSECGAAVKAYMECTRYIIMQTEDSPTPSHILMDQVLPVVQASLFENRSPLHQSPLYGMLGNLLTGLELGENSSGKQTASQFWSQLKENVELNLSATEELSGGKNFEERLVTLVKFLYYPETEVAKQKTGKVKFRTITDKDSGDGFISEKPMRKQPQRVELGKSARVFVQDLILLTFELAHKHFSTTHLKVFAQLLELDSSEETVCRVIECCHGEVATETTSHYFVFEICIPWLKNLQERKEASDTSEAFKHVVHVVCLFMPVLDKDAVSTLLEKLFDGCIDSEAEYILFEKLFSLSTVSRPVQDWLQSNKFTDRLVARLQSVSCVTGMEELATKIEHSLSILNVVLKTRTVGEDLVVQEGSIEKLLTVLLQTIEGLNQGIDGTRINSLVRFVSEAAYSFYSKYRASLQTVAGNQLLLQLFQLALSNQHSVTEETLSAARQACCEGVRAVVKQTGGLLYDSGLLGRISAIVQETVGVAVRSMEKLRVAMETVKDLLRAILSSLPERDSSNPVYMTYSSQMLVPVCGNVPSKVWNYLCIRGDYPIIAKSSDDGTFPALTLFTSLYNCLLLSFINTPIHQSDNELIDDQRMDVVNSEPSWTPERLEKLVDCIQGSEIVQMYSQQSKEVMMVPSIMETSSQLSSHIQSLLKSLGEGDRQSLWKICYDRSARDQDFVISQKKVLSLLRDVQIEPLVLELASILERCRVLTEMSVATLANTVDYMLPSDQLTLTEIMVARILSLPLESVLQLDGGMGLLFCLSQLVAAVTQSHEQEAGELVPSALEQVMAWKEEKEEILLYNCNVSESPADAVLFNAALARFLGVAVQHVPHKLSHEQWDFTMCSLVSWVQSIEESKADLQLSPSAQSFAVSVCQFLVQVVVCITEKAGKSPDLYPANLVTEWTEFFSESVFTTILPLFLQIYKDSKDNDSRASGADALVLSALCEATSYTEEQHILEHKLPPLLVAGDLSPLPDNLQTLMNHMCPLLLANGRAVQVTAFKILYRVVGKLPEYDKDDKSFVAGATGGDKQEEEMKRSPPAYLMQVLDQTSGVLDALLCDVSVESCLTIAALKEEFQVTMAYLLSWKLLLKFFASAPSELRQEYALYLRDQGFVERLMQHLFGLMPNNPGSMFQQEPQLAAQGQGTSHEVQHLACALYIQVLRTIPAMARNWWKEQDRKTAAYIDMFTTKHASQILCAAEIQGVQNTENKLEDMTIKSRPATREVIATYSLEEVTIEMVISLPQNYPLGNISVTSEKRVGVSKPQWEKWLLQLNIFLQHQNGNILDGLRLWKNNIDKKFEGVGECMICFYVLHGTNFQLPKITCRTCKKKFHSACLFKWFKTSLNPTCPLCRNVF